VEPYLRLVSAARDASARWIDWSPMTTNVAPSPLAIALAIALTRWICSHEVWKVCSRNRPALRRTASAGERGDWTCEQPGTGTDEPKSTSAAEERPRALSATRELAIVWLRWLRAMRLWGGGLSAYCISYISI